MSPALFAFAQRAILIRPLLVSSLALCLQKCLVTILIRAISGEIPSMALTSFGFSKCPAMTYVLRARMGTSSRELQNNRYEDTEHIFLLVCPQNTLSRLRLRLSSGLFLFFSSCVSDVYVAVEIRTLSNTCIIDSIYLGFTLLNILSVSPLYTECLH